MPVLLCSSVSSRFQNTLAINSSGVTFRLNLTKWQRQTGNDTAAPWLVTIHVTASIAILPMDCWWTFRAIFDELVMKVGGIKPVVMLADDQDMQHRRWINSRIWCGMALKCVVIWLSAVLYQQRKSVEIRPFRLQGQACKPDFAHLRGGCRPAKLKSGDFRRV